MDFDDPSEQGFNSMKDTPSTRAGKLKRTLEGASITARWILCIMPIGVLLLIPILWGVYGDRDLYVFGIRLDVLGEWLEIAWLSFWAIRIIVKIMPYFFGTIAGAFTNRYHKWQEMGKHLELPTALFLWWLGVGISFKPLIRRYTKEGYHPTYDWHGFFDRISYFIRTGLVLRLLAKLFLHFLAVKFHHRTYADRIELNKMAISSLIKLYIYAEQRQAVARDAGISRSNPALDLDPRCIPMVGSFSKIFKRHNKGHKSPYMADRTYPRMEPVQLKLAHSRVRKALKTRKSSQDIAQHIYQALVPEHGRQEAHLDMGRMAPAFDSDEEARLAYDFLDKSEDGNISLEEFKDTCMAIGLEQKDLNSSISDLGEVIGKLSKVLTAICLAIAFGAFLLDLQFPLGRRLRSIYLTMFAYIWAFVASAQDFMQNMIFVFVRHPYDVGDRVYIAGNAGFLLLGEDLFVKKISLLYTEFRRLDGTHVQAPNSYLNTLFISNMRRSGTICDIIPFTLSSDTTAEGLEEFQQKVMDIITTEEGGFRGDVFLEANGLNVKNEPIFRAIVSHKTMTRNEYVQMKRRSRITLAIAKAASDMGLAPTPLSAFESLTERVNQSVLNLGRAGSATHMNAGFPNIPSAIPT